MPGRYYYYTLILLLVHCTALFNRSNEFEKGLDFYRHYHFEPAKEHFVQYYNKHPESDTVLYYLYDCYRKLGDIKKTTEVLEQFVKLGSEDRNIYLNLFNIYRQNKQYKKMFFLLINAPPKLTKVFDEHYILTRQLFAELICGVAGQSSKTDPIIFAVSNGYLSVPPGGKFYPDDPLSNAHLIIALDRLLKPIYPKKFYKLHYIASNSFLYLPYMRLITLKIMDYIPDLIPQQNTSIITATRALWALHKRGIID